MKLDLNINSQLIADTLISGFEGGIGYWSQIENYIQPKKLTFRTDETIIYKYVDYPMSIDGAVILRDLETDELHTLDLNKIKTGLNLMVQDYPRHFADILNENGDAETGDVLIQLALFNKIVYG